MAISILFIALAGTTAGHAEPVPDTLRLPPTEEASAARAPSVERRWYGWQIMLTDVAAIGLLATSLMAREDGSAGHLSESLEGAGMGAWLLGGPTIHLAHGDAIQSIGSLALRGLLPIAGAIVGSSIGEAGAEGELLAGLQEGIYGLLAGAATAAVLDWTLLSYETVARPASEASQPGSLAPSIAFTKSSVSLGVRGSF